jgi:hypothetical protein
MPSGIWNHCCKNGLIVVIGISPLRAISLHLCITYEAQKGRSWWLAASCSVSIGDVCTLVNDVANNQTCWRLKKQECDPTFPRKPMPANSIMLSLLEDANMGMVLISPVHDAAVPEMAAETNWRMKRPGMFLFQEEVHEFHIQRR